jgi:Rieske Fe-S protein
VSVEPPERAPVAGWREQFPYRLDADDLVSRREFLRISVVSSGALFGGTLLLGVLGSLTDQRRGGTAVEVARRSELQPNEVRYFNFPGPEDHAVLINLPDQGPVAYSQKCTHLSCAVYYQTEPAPRLFCPCHEGVFSVADGSPTAGPPQRRLPRIRLEQRGDTLYAVEEIP